MNETNITNASDAEAIINAVLKLSPIEVNTLQIDDEGEKLPYIIGRNAAGEIAHNHLGELVDMLRQRPKRRLGRSNLDSALSLVNFAQRYKGANSTLWARLDSAAAELSVVLNDHNEGADGLPEFNDFRGYYTAAYSKEWQEWTSNAGKKMSQGDFAEWIEERLPDLTGKATHPRVLEVFSRMEVEPASPAQLLQVSRGMRVQVASKVADAKNLSTGETEVTYAEEHTHVDKTGQKIRVPSAFVIRLPVFDHDEPVEVAAFLRYSLEAGGVKWLYRLHRPHLAREERFLALAQQVATDAGLPLFLGKH